MSERSRLRLVVLQVLVISLLATLLGRLWFLQVMVSERYTSLADANTTRQIVTPAVRGQILDDQGRPLARNRTAMVVSVSRPEMDKQPDDGKAMVARLAALLGKTETELWNRTRLCGPESSTAGCWRGSPYQPIQVTDQAEQSAAQQILERQEVFPGVSAGLTAVREYPSPEKANAAHLIGYLGPVTDAELAKRATGDQGQVALQTTDQSGRAGLEAEYDELLRGTPGVREVAVDLAGRVVGELSDERATPGNYLVTSIDARVQAVAEQALAQAMADARTKGDPNKNNKRFLADSGAVVVMDVRTGRIVAMASNPTYDLAIWADGLSVSENAALTDKASNYPLISRATQGDFAPASTFKVVSTAAVAKAGYSLQGDYDCPSVFELGGQKFDNYESQGYGKVSFQRGLEVSCDTMFYKFAADLWRADGDVKPTDPDEAMVKMAKSFGLGQRTGIDLPDENSGRIVDREYKRKTWQEKKELWCARAAKARPSAKTDYEKFLVQLDQDNCESYYQYRGGDAVNFAVGQGDTLVTPLQMARVYAAVANGGTLWTPQLGTAEMRPDGTVVREFAPKQAGSIPVEASTLSFLNTALTAVTTDGTGKGPFAGFPLAKIPVASKTGTGEVYGKQSTAWFAAYAPANDAKYAVVMMVSQGGTGSGTAGPGVRAIFESLFGVAGSTVDPAKAAIPGVVPPTALPQVAPDGSVWAPGASLPSPSASAVASGAVPTLRDDGRTRS